MSKEFKSGNLTLIAGLGNPGNEYERTYHNVGWQALGELAGDAAFTTPRGKPFSYVRLGNGVTLVKPLTFMNESGSGVRAAMRFMKTSGTRGILLIHDDSDLLVGTWKLQFGRGAAGHNGVASVIGALKTKDIWRVRIGIRPPLLVQGKPRKKAGEFVLKKITAADAQQLTRVYREIKEALAPSTE